jgi:hypothetical protein
MKKKDIILHTDLKGKDWMYHGNIYHVLEVQDNGTRIITDKRTWTFGTDDERDYFLAELLPCETPKLPASSKQRPVIAFVADAKSEDLFAAMLGEMKADFDDIKTKPDYVKQAAQRCRQVTTMTNLVKTRIQLEKFNQGQ